jgi:hypothetical protein
MEYVSEKLSDALKRGVADLSDDLIAKYSTKNNSLKIQIIDANSVVSPSFQIREFIKNLNFNNRGDSSLFKELLFDIMADNKGNNIRGTGFSGGANRGSGLQFSITQMSFVNNAQSLGSINIAAENLYAFYKKNSSNIYNSYIEILKRVSEQTSSINRYLTTGLPSEGTAAIGKTEETKAMLDSSIRAGKNV